VAIAPAALTLAACGGGGGSSRAEETKPASAGAAQRTIHISEAEFSLTPNSIHVAQPGSVAFKVRNVGQIAHALEIEGNGVEQETEAIQPGSSATLTVRLPKSGSYEMYCPIDGHKANGMKGSIQVGGSSAGGGMETGGGTTTGNDMTTTEGTTTDKRGGSGY
jgi:uncharacterized cupredoxin-like copper-binding protein